MTETFIQNLEILTCRRIIEENHNDEILQLVEKPTYCNSRRYLATISPTQVNIYDNEDSSMGIGFFAHYSIEETPYFKGGTCTTGCWLFPQKERPLDCYLATGTSLGEVFILSCNECTVVSILTNDTGSPITSMAVSPVYPEYLLVTEKDGSIRCWNVVSKNCEFCLNNCDARYICWDGPESLVLLQNDDLKILSMTNRELEAFELLGDNLTPITGIMSLPLRREWVVLTTKEIHRVNWDSRVDSVFQTENLHETFCPNRYSVAVDNSYICISDNSNTLCVDVNGKVIGGLVDNYATGGQPGKEQTSYRKEPIVTAIIYPDAKSAVMIEKNRVMRFDTLDPNDRFVAHIKFPHPVEDMFLFYESLNAEPLMYLFPKIQQEEE
ncbi:hypothetical protein WA171_002283 [Blastocystis sp. BT1]